MAHKDPKKMKIHRAEMRDALDPEKQEQNKEREHKNKYKNKVGKTKK